jgi:hypothetical protein
MVVTLPDLWLHFPVGGVRSLRQCPA